MGERGGGGLVGEGRIKGGRRERGYNVGDRDRLT